MRQELATAHDVGDDHDVKREKLVMVRLTAEQHAKWQAAADAAKRTLADWVRVTVDEKLEASKKPRKGR